MLLFVIRLQHFDLFFLSCAVQFDEQYFDLVLRYAVQCELLCAVCIIIIILLIIINSVLQTNICLVIFMHIHSLRPYLVH